MSAVVEVTLRCTNKVCTPIGLLFVHTANLLHTADQLHSLILLPLQLWTSP
jgi:hypothetical protein